MMMMVRGVQAKFNPQGKGQHELQKVNVGNCEEVTIGHFLFFYSKFLSVFVASL